MTKPQRAANVGRPDLLELEAQNRIQHTKSRGFDHLPNPVQMGPNGPANRGPVMNPEAPEWRAGLTAEKYHAMTLKYEEQKARNKVADDFRPELLPSESEAYKAYLDGLKAKKKEEKAA